MRRFVLMIFVCCILKPFAFKSQPAFTYSMVYNFNIGDTFQYKRSTNQNVMYITQVVISKTLVPGGDTLKYGFFNKSVYYQMVYPGGVSSATGSGLSTITNLNDTVVPPPYNFYTYSCSNGNTYCNKATRTYNSVPDSGNYEADTHQFRYSSGLGLTYEYDYNYQTSLSYPVNMYIGFTSDLIWYHKVGEMPCGTYYYYPVGIKESEKLHESLTISPNPANTSFTIKFTEEIKTISLIDLLGKSIVVEAKNNQFDISFLPKGIYFVRLSENSREFVSKLIITD
jgi:hypothetical protein